MINLQIGGLVPFTTVDYPGALAAVVFCQGCPWRCRYCQNGHLVPRCLGTQLRWQDVRELLDQRRGLLDAVVFSGGEPTLQRDLPAAVAECRERGFRVGLHTAGCYPERLDELLPYIDWVGLDIKAHPEDYGVLTGIAGSGEKAFESLEYLVGSGVDHEVRVTVHDDLLPPPRLRELLERIDSYGPAAVSVQRCRSESMLDPSLGHNASKWAGDLDRLSLDEWFGRQPEPGSKS
ncbi:MAG: anaerobic ribonucleoside-triphosphate reductase activating protein [Gammaproteobacteria bacterium]|nr:anaerobic ribonucleoside-triphosphate reductase activating protein [Gammaproteobacteria bacterium]